MMNVHLPEVFDTDSQTFLSCHFWVVINRWTTNGSNSSCLCHQRQTAKNLKTSPQHPLHNVDISMSTLKSSQWPKVFDKYFWNNKNEQPLQVNTMRVSYSRFCSCVYHCPQTEIFNTLKSVYFLPKRKVSGVQDQDTKYKSSRPTENIVHSKKYGSYPQTIISISGRPISFVHFNFLPCQLSFLPPKYWRCSVLPKNKINTLEIFKLKT